MSGWYVLSAATGLMVDNDHHNRRRSGGIVNKTSLNDSSGVHMRKISKKRVARRRIRSPVNPGRVRKPVAKRKLPWWLKRLDNPGEVSRVQVDALRRQVKANGRLKMVRCWLIKTKDRNGRWVIRLRGGITGREYLRAERYAGDCFFRVRLYGWEVHKGKLSEDPNDDYLWISGQEIADTLRAFGWL